MKKKLKSGVILFSLVLALLIANQCLAVSLVDTSGHYSNGSYTLDDVRSYAIYLMKLILGLVGTLSLLFFVYGGLTFLLSSGNSDQVKKGMGIIKAATVGLLLTFSSVMIINMFFGGIGVKWDSKTGAVSATNK